MYGKSSKYPDALASDRSAASAFLMASLDTNPVNRSDPSAPKNHSSASAKEAETGSTLTATPTTHIDTMAHAPISASDRPTSDDNSSQRPKKRDERIAEPRFLSSDNESATTASRIGLP
jgi:hypothetical protein